jgi:phage terminase large subunit GpA-like protein
MVASLFPWHLFTPREPIRTLDWARQNVFDKDGLPYDDHAFPHLGAPGGPLDALDFRQVLEIWLQWATRLGKSFAGQVGSMKNADRDPCPMMLAGPDRKLAPEVIGKLYKMLEHCPPLAPQLLPPSRRSKQLVTLAYCQMYVAWARSSATLADKAVRYGHAFEIDKWEQKGVASGKASEADPLALFFERFKEFVTYKRVIESSPAVKGKSRVERGRLAGHNCRLEVPCPHCDHYQVLRLGDGREAGGIVWEHDAAGRSDETLARKTANYVCEECEEPIGDEHRGQMMRAGVWIPEGCTADPDKARRAAEDARKFGRPLWRGWGESPWIVGEPLRDGPIYSSQLSSLYALSLTWGDVAGYWLHCQKHPEELRNFVNSWAGETWSVVQHDDDWQKLIRRLLMGPDVARGQVPKGYTNLTAGIDKQADSYPAMIVAWGPLGQPHIVDYAELPTEERLLDFVCRDFAGDGGAKQRIKLGLFDAGNRPHGVHELCDKAKKRGLALIPCKGSSTAMGVPYVKKRLGENTSRPGAPHVMVDTITTQDWIEKRLHNDQQRGFTSVYRAPLGDHQDLGEQLLNDAPVQKTDKQNQTRESWDRIDATIPNDYRDTFRYAFVAWLLRNRGRETPQQSGTAADHKPKRAAKRRPQRSTPLKRPGGWLSQMP